MDVRALLSELNIEFKDHGESPLVSAGWVGVECPFCGKGTNKPGLGVHLRTLRCSCWKCGAHHLASVLHETTGLPWASIKQRLTDLDANLDVSRITKPTGRYREPVGVGPLLPVHRQYLVKRGFDPDETAEVWGVRGIGLAPKLQWRLFLPVTVRDKPVSWITRAIGDVELRYISADPTDESVHLKQTLYGEGLAKQAVIVVEGPIDAWRIGPGAVATYGLSHTPAQVARIARYSTRVICFDREAAAQRRARRLADDLCIMPGETYVVTLSGPDPDGSPPEEIAELRKQFLQ